MSNGASTIQRLVRYVPLAACLVGIFVILWSTVLFNSEYPRVAGATAGILVLLAAVWYAANPFFKNTRRYLPLRAEVVRFIDLARELNGAVVDGAAAHEIERSRSLLHEAVERIVAVAGKTKLPTSDSGTTMARAVAGVP
jgi:hypothetical protein